MVALIALMSLALNWRDNPGQRGSVGGASSLARDLSRINGCGSVRARSRLGRRHFRWFQADRLNLLTVPHTFASLADELVPTSSRHLAVRPGERSFEQRLLQLDRGPVGKPGERRLPRAARDGCEVPRGPRRRGSAVRQTTIARGFFDQGRRRLSRVTNTPGVTSASKR